MIIRKTYPLKYALSIDPVRGDIVRITDWDVDAEWDEYILKRTAREMFDDPNEGMRRIALSEESLKHIAHRFDCRLKEMVRSGRFELIRMGRSW